MTVVQLPSVTAPVRPPVGGIPGARVLVSSVPSDSHVWNLIVLQLLIEEMGAEVVNLGPCVPVETLRQACREHRPDCVVISTVNGHGYFDGRQLITELRADDQLAGLPVVIGGLLHTGGGDTRAVRADLLACGFDEVFPVAGGAAEAAEQVLRRFLTARLAARP